MSDNEKWFKTPGGRRVREDGSTEIIRPAENPVEIGATTLIATAELNRLRSESAILRDEHRMWECPDCAFAFAAEHDDEGGGYSCPVCENARLHWDVTVLRSALENWGRHHDWCGAVAKGSTSVVLSCNCGYIAALETGYVPEGGTNDTKLGR